MRKVWMFLGIGFVVFGSWMSEARSQDCTEDVYLCDNGVDTFADGDGLGSPCSESGGIWYCGEDESINLSIKYWTAYSGVAGQECAWVWEFCPECIYSCSMAVGDYYQPFDAYWWGYDYTSTDCSGTGVAINGGTPLDLNDQTPFTDTYTPFLDAPGSEDYKCYERWGVVLIPEDTWYEGQQEYYEYSGNYIRVEWDE